jgi:hypothetical protein
LFGGGSRDTVEGGDHLDGGRTVFGGTIIDPF